jgi:hypothetical protein
MSCTGSARWMWAAGLGTAVYALGVRPWHLKWGATRDEQTANWPGDELIPLKRCFVAAELQFKKHR